MSERATNDNECRYKAVTLPWGDEPWVVRDLWAAPGNFIMAEAKAYQLNDDHDDESRCTDDLPTDDRPCTRYTMALHEDREWVVIDLDESRIVARFGETDKDWDAAMRETRRLNAQITVVK